MYYLAIFHISKHTVKSKVYHNYVGKYPCSI